MSRGKGNQLARRRGRSFEYRVAKLLDGYVYTGTDGDVVAGDTIVECKYRRGFRLMTLTELDDWITQAKRNAAAWAQRGQPKAWLLALTGGGRSGAYVLLPLERYQQLKEQAHAAQDRPLRQDAQRQDDAGPDLR